MKKVHNYWGQPTSISEFKNGFVEFYDDETSPLFFYYDENKKFLDWELDSQTIHERELVQKELEHQRQIRAIEEDHRQQLYEIRRAQIDQENQQAWQSLGSTLNNINTQNQIDRIHQNQQYLENRQQQILQNQNTGGPVRVNQFR